MEPPVIPRRPPASGRGKTRAAALALALLPASVCAAAPPAGAGGDQATLQRQIETLQRTARQLDLQRQIEALRRAVEQLQRRVHTLEARLPPPAPAAATGAAVPGTRPAAPASAAATPVPAPPSNAKVLTPQIKENWRALKRGMSADQVRGLLGAPSRRLEINGQPLWYYYYTGTGGGSVMFSDSAMVVSWQHPPFGWLW